MLLSVRRACIFHCVCVCVSQVRLTRRPLRNDEKCGKGEHANLAARHAGASVARSGRVVPHGGLRSRTLRLEVVTVSVGPCGSGPGRESVQLQQPALSAPCPRPNVTARPVKAIALWRRYRSRHAPDLFKFKLFQHNYLGHTYTQLWPTTRCSLVCI